jgi:hypothetical protein
MNFGCSLFWYSFISTSNLPLLSFTLIFPLVLTSDPSIVIFPSFETSTNLYVFVELSYTYKPEPFGISLIVTVNVSLPSLSVDVTIIGNAIPFSGFVIVSSFYKVNLNVCKDTVFIW